VTLREESEWVETLQAGWNVLAGTDPDRILAATMRQAPLQTGLQNLYGDGHSAKRIAEALLEK